MQRIPDDELTEIKALLSDDQDAEGGDLSLDAILSEYHYTNATDPSTQGKPLLDVLLDEVTPVEMDGLEKRNKDMFERRAGNVRREPEHDEDTQRIIGLAKAIREAEITPEQESGDTGKEDKQEEIRLDPDDQFAELFSRPNEYVLPEEDEDDDGELEPDKKKIMPFFKRKTAPEVVSLPPAQAYTKAQNTSMSLRARSVIAIVFLAPMVFITCFQPFSFMPDFLSYDTRPYIVIFILAVLQILVMLCGIDILAKGASDFARLRPGAETLALFSCLATLAHVITLVLPLPEDVKPIGFMPYCAVSAGAVFFALRGHTHRCRAYARTYKTAASAGNEPDCVFLADSLWDGEPAFVRRAAGAEDFTAAAEKPDVVNRVTSFFAPLVLILSFVLALLASFNHNDGGQYFFWTLSAIACAGVPMTTFGAFSYVFSRIAARVGHMGGALAGWQGAMEMSNSNTLIITDTDLFPPGSIKRAGPKSRDNSFTYDTVCSYMASLIAASGSGMYKAFEDEKNRLRQVGGFEASEGGVSGVIDGMRVMLGTLNYMHRMGIYMPRDMNIKNAVFISVNSSLAGVAVLTYSPSPTTEGALALLEQNKFNMVLAVRDFNITPTLLKNEYGADDNKLEYPVVEDRILLSSPEAVPARRAVAILAREGLCPYAESIIGGRRLKKFTMINLGVHLIALVSSLFLAYYFTHQAVPGAAAAITPANFLLFNFIWWGFQWIISRISGRY